MKIIDCDQGSEEWFKIRTGIPTASSFDKLITTKGEPSKQAQKYMYRLAGESVSGKAEETYQSAAMLQGIEREQEARQLYTVVTGREVKEVGFCLAEDGYGCSPDGFVKEDGMVEIKNPLIATHVGYLLANKLPTDYIQQVQGQLFVTDRAWCDFVSYSPGIKPLIIRVERDEEFIKKLEVELKVFCIELKELINKIK